MCVALLLGLQEHRLDEPRVVRLRVRHDDVIERGQIDPTSIGGLEGLEEQGLELAVRGVDERCFVGTLDGVGVVSGAVRQRKLDVEAVAVPIQGPDRAGVLGDLLAAGLQPVLLARCEARPRLLLREHLRLLQGHGSAPHPGLLLAPRGGANAAHKRRPRVDGSRRGPGGAQASQGDLTGPRPRRPGRHLGPLDGHVVRPQQLSIGALVQDLPGINQRVKDRASPCIHQALHIALQVRGSSLDCRAAIFRLLLGLQVSSLRVACGHADRQHAQREGPVATSGRARAEQSLHGREPTLLRQELRQRPAGGSIDELLNVHRTATISVQ
mmetsp:Transcript_28092/g.71096  ORF Transcript_28092/g.71096 Transcript_28092/m.71096 type:complete len:326 (-) Transcript_28092:51-1028(-)